MFTAIVTPRFGDMDVLGHINNTVLAVWFEQARNPLFVIFAPKSHFADGTFQLIMAHTDYDFVGELMFGTDVEIRSYISRIGTKSFTVYQEAWQSGKLCCKGNAVIVHYDFGIKESIPIPEDKKTLLAEHAYPKVLGVNHE
ncbi:MAG: acyl-CoA thioesterase [Spirochaetaceae bacterium]|jgi:acyl-CoA thioester hydrolase|nr:acyl-CoA thioesterase [Spirochaetaceae bacterium]